MIDIHQNMPISLILTQFDYFQIPPSFAVTPNLILEPCRIELLGQLKNEIFQVCHNDHIWASHVSNFLL